ncbi:MAG: glucan biosynthesis protein, partial [Pirellulaceae bacterium]
MQENCSPALGQFERLALSALGREIERRSGVFHKTGDAVRGWLPLRVVLSWSFVLVVASGVAINQVRAVEATPWSFEKLRADAERRAAQAFQPDDPLPDALRRLNYDQYRLIAFEHERAIWKRMAAPFALECFHRGYQFTDRVELYLVHAGWARRIPFDRSLFQY